MYIEGTGDAGLIDNPYPRTGIAADTTLAWKRLERRNHRLRSRVFLHR